jgi:hypothetical protein
MIFRTIFKTPDAVYESVKDIAEQEACGIVDEDENCDRQSEIRTELEDFASKWVKFGEMITVEFDTEKGTANIVTI